MIPTERLLVVYLSSFINRVYFIFEKLNKHYNTYNYFKALSKDTKES